MQCKTIIHIESDRGTTDGLGYCGWIIATDTIILVKEYGHAPGQGHQMESLQAKSYGCVTALLFILPYRIHHNITHYTQE
eukprot:13447774-Ditylum_brightwellii.AAC.1